MINYIFTLFIIIGIIFSFITGNTNNINNEILKSSKKALEMIINLLPILCLWLGIMKVAEDSGLLNKLSLLLGKIITPIFPELKKESPAISYIASNMLMNIFGLGNAATPFGLKAMKELQKENKNKEVASRSMITFLVINTASLTLIPTTIISMRMLNHSKNPNEILLASIITTSLSLVIALLIDRLFYYIWKRKNKYE